MITPSLVVYLVLALAVALGCVVLVCLWLIARAVPGSGAAAGNRRVDFMGALLCVLGLGGSVFALIEQPRLGWSNPAVAGSLIGGVILFAAFVLLMLNTSRNGANECWPENRNRFSTCASNTATLSVRYVPVTSDS